MHPTVLAWGREVVTQHDLASGSVLEVGSLDVNGSLRPLFEGFYVGVDRRDGFGVNKVMAAAQLDFAPASFDVVVCTEMLEHDETFWLSLREMDRVLAKGGHLILTTRSNGWPDHDHPADYYRFSLDAIRWLVEEWLGLEVIELVTDPGGPGVLCLAKKVGPSPV